uniref:FH2 domain-containing protein n=1 Tax=Echinostoma caproni TaxID=27848 RepID=A0A183B9S3_9TREM
LNRSTSSSPERVDNLTVPGFEAYSVSPPKPASPPPPPPPTPQAPAPTPPPGTNKPEPQQNWESSCTILTQDTLSNATIGDKSDKNDTSLTSNPLSELEKSSSLESQPEIEEQKNTLVQNSAGSTSHVIRGTEHSSIGGNEMKSQNEKPELHDSAIADVQSVLPSTQYSYFVEYDWDIRDEELPVSM